MMKEYTGLYEDEICEIIRHALENGYTIYFENTSYYIPGALYEDGYISDNKPMHENTINGLYVKFTDKLKNKCLMSAYSLVNMLVMKQFYVIEH